MLYGSSPSPDSHHNAWPVVVIGAGAAGLMAAITAARSGARVLLLETRRAPGAKIRASGGGRCNVLPGRVSLCDFHTHGSANTMRNILFSWPHDQVVDFFTRDLGLQLKTESTGKMFPVSDDAREVVDALVDAAKKAGVTLAYDAKVSRMSRMSQGWLLTTARAEFAAERVIVAAGGLSLPRSGSDGTGWSMVQNLGHTLMPTYPALVPLCTGDSRWQALSGIATEVTLQAVRDGKTVAGESGPMLFTHRGISGPAVLNISRWFTEPHAAGTQLYVAWGAPHDFDTALRAGREARPQTTVGCIMREHLPKRLVETLASVHHLPLETRLCDLTRAHRLAVTDVLARMHLPVSGSEGYRTAEVTGGGVPLTEIYPKTLESRIAPGLYLAGEMLDAVGRLGGYNFLWAWVTGRRAGLAAAAAVATLPSSDMRGGYADCGQSPRQLSAS